MRSFAVLTLLALLSQAVRADHDIDVLRRNGVIASKADISRYLHTLYPDAATQQVIERLVGELGSDHAQRRIDAGIALERMGSLPIRSLQVAVGSTDPEVARRARGLLLKARRALNPELMYVTYRVIHSRRLKGLVEEVIATVPLTTARFVREAGGRALGMTARRTDVPQLRALTRESTTLQAPAVHALARVLDRDARDDLVALLEHGSDRVRAAAAWELADMADRACFPALSALLDAGDIEVRLTAWRALRAITRVRFGYAPYETAAERKKATAKWRRWIKANGETAHWKLPLPTHALRGRFLVAMAGKNKVVEIDESGTKTWEVAAVNPWCCSGVRNGHRLVTHFEKSLVLEYDAAGTQVWQLKLPGKACSVERLENGNTLVAIGSVGAVFEYLPNGKITWEVRLKGRPFFATRLPNGNTIVSLHDGGRVVEVDPKKKVTEHLKGLRGPYSVRRLENGNWLVCLVGTGCVVELTPAGKEVWSVAKLGWPASAYRLESGATVVAHRGGLEEFLPTGERRWLLRVKKGSVFVSRY